MTSSRRHFLRASLALAVGLRADAASVTAEGRTLWLDDFELEPQMAARGLAWSHDGRYLAACGHKSDAVIVYDMHHRAERRRFNYHRAASDLRSLTFLGRTKILASAGVDEPVVLFDVESETEVARLPLAKGARELAASPDGKTLVTGGAGAANFLWDVEHRRIRASIDGHGAPLSAITYAPHGGTLACGDKHGQVSLWNSETGQRRFLLYRSIEQDVIRSLDFSPDGRYLAVGNADCRCRVWDLALREPVAHLDPSQSMVLAARFSPDGKLLAVAVGRTMVMYSATTFEPLASSDVHGTGMVNAVFSRDGKYLASGGFDYKLYVTPVADLLEGFSRPPVFLY